MSTRKQVISAQKCSKCNDTQFQCYEVENGTMFSSTRLFFSAVEINGCVKLPLVTGKLRGVSLS